jgi:hypothetical protein
MSVSLDEFFVAMLPFLERRATAQDAERILGSSPSGSARFALYPEFLRRQKRSILDGFFRATRFACDSIRPKLWNEVVEDYLRAVRPSHWEPNHYAEPMLAFLKQWQKPNHPALPEFVHELADFAWIRFASMIAEHPEDGGPHVGTAIHVRQYTHEVHHYSIAAEDETLKPGALPEPTSCTLLVGRSRLAARLKIVRPSVAALFALHLRQTPGAQVKLPAGLTLEDIANEDAALVQLGMLGPKLGQADPAPEGLDREARAVESGA